MRERETDSPTDRTRLASTSSDVATAQQSPGLASLSISRRGGFPSLPSREKSDPPRRHPLVASRAPHLFQGHGSIQRPSVRTSVRKLTATTVTMLCTRDRPRRTCKRLRSTSDEGVRERYAVKRAPVEFANVDVTGHFSLGVTRKARGVKVVAETRDKTNESLYSEITLARKFFPQFFVTGRLSSS